MGADSDASIRARASSAVPSAPAAHADSSAPDMYAAHTSHTFTTRVVARPRAVSRAAGVARARAAMPTDARIVAFAPEVRRATARASTDRSRLERRKLTEKKCLLTPGARRGADRGGGEG